MEMDYTEDGREKFDNYLERIRKEIAEMKIPEREREKLYSLVDETAQRNIEIMNSYVNGIKNAVELEKSQKKLEGIFSSLILISKDVLGKCGESKAMLEQKGKLLN